MRLKVHAPVPPSLRSREEKLRNRIPKISSLLDTIKNRTDKYKFGISNQEINKYYRFSDRKNSENFFSERFKKFGKDYVDTQEIEIDVKNSVNTIETDDTEDRPTDRFEKLAEKFCGELNLTRSYDAPYVSILTGPTGSGKTAYSKCLFTAGIKQFWKNKVVPTRVEFTRFFKAGEELSSGQILSAIHQCQVRDLLLYLCLSKKDKLDTNLINRLIPEDGIYRKYNLSIRNFASMTDGYQIDGKEYTLFRAHNLWKTQVKFFPTEICERILSNVKAPELNIQFLVSLDGFDAIKTKDFLVSDRYHGPISAVADLLGDALNQVAHYGGTSASHNTNLIVFMRDTTYARIKLELKLTPNGERDIPVRWIVPPSYKTLVETVSAAINKDVLQTDENRTSFLVENIRKSITKSLSGSFINFLTDQPVSSAFSWNARHMKRHIRRFCVWSLENYVQTHESLVDKLIASAGVSESWLWEKATNNPSMQRIPEYSVLEAFFLDDTKCLQSKFRLRSREISDILSKNDLETALNFINERPEIEGLFDSIFNYLTKGNDVFEDQCYPHLLVLVRILQVLEKNKGLNVEDIYDKILLFYKNISLEEIRFYTICLCENEYVVFEGIENSSNLDECYFYISNFGRILINKVLYSITYLSQSLMIAELNREGLGQYFKERSFRSNEDWVAHCICNAIIGYNIIKACEDYEFSHSNDKKFYSDYYITVKLRKSILNESKRIFSAMSDRNRLQWHYNNIPEYFKVILKENKDFDVIEEIWK